MAQPLPSVASMNLTIWLPSLFLLGVAGFALLFAFITACERV
jgi:hypothetical protein